MILVGERAVERECPCVAAGSGLSKVRVRSLRRASRKCNCAIRFRGRRAFDEATLVSAGRAGSGAGVGRACGSAGAGRSAPDGADGQGRARRGEGDRAGRGDGRRGGQHRRHGPAAARRDGPAVHRALRARRRWGRSCAASRSGTCASSTRSPPGWWRTWPGTTPLLPGAEQIAYLDVDDTIRATYGYAKQGAGYGYSGVKGLNALIAALSTPSSAPVIVATRLRKGSANSARGAARLVADALETSRACGRERAAGRAGGLGVLRPRRDRRHRPGEGPVLHHRPTGRRRAPGDRRDR